eukprot:maker-scaffold1040_size68023-snap-gene-0.17 protein:Tk07635 transcript:maker-scaffold1040_size68023-snap-gene-0.17-mRNA-1 annotation:"centrosomal protein of 192 kda-like"
MASDPRARSGQPRPWGLYPGPAHPDDDDDDDLSPLLRIPVSPSVVTPSGTPPSPWLASTGSKPVGAVSRLSATRAWGGEPTASPASDEIPSHVPIFSRPGRIPEPSLDSQTLVGHQGSALQSPTVSLTQTGLVGFHRSFGSASLAMERSSFGLLPPENLSPGGEDSPTAHGQSERMSSLFANLSCRRPKSTLGPADQESAPARANEDVFKIPALPAHIVREKSMALAETSGFGIDQRFEELNAKGPHDSFFNGQFSARSTSFGGSNEDSESRTRDEQFLDFSHLRQASRSNVDPGGSFLSGPEDFAALSQDLGDMDGDTLTGLNRPDLGFAPPREPVAERPPTVNSTFTVTDDESARIAEKVEAFKHLDVKTLQDLISRASSDHNPQYYASLIAQIAQKQALDVTSAQNATVSDLLPSFLDPDETQVLPQKSPAKPGELVPPKKSRIPIRSPKHAAMTSGIPIRKGSAPNVGSKKIVTGPRFSSPQKRYQRVSSKVEDTEERREKATKQLFKENRDPKVTSAKLEDTEERREKATKQLFKENCDPKTNCDPKATISETSCAVFPLDSDRSVMNWFSVILGRSEEQILVLRNKLERELTVNLMIRESKDFKIGLSTSQTLTLAPLSTLDVAVIFSPSDLDFCTGKLVIKPQGVSQPGGKTYKASILLQGQGGAPTLHFDGFGEVSNGKRSLHLGQISDLETHVVRRMRVENAGNAAAFIKLQGFRDEECRVTDDAYIALTPNEFVVEAKGAVSVALTLNPNLMTGDGSGSFLGSIALFHGPEVCRQVMLQARKPPLARANPKPAKTVYLAAETLYFPTTRVGTNSLTKVVLKNRTQSPATFHVEDIKLPFKNKHKTVTVQPNAFMNVPIFYAPTNAGPHQTAVTFRGREGRNLVAILKGSTPV